MRLKKILKNCAFKLNEGRTAPLNGVRQASEFYEEKGFSNYSFSKSQIFRGIKDGPRYGYIEPKNFSRKSANTKNYYTLILDNSNRWSQYPDRSKSIVCSTGQRAASNYGSVYLVVPEGNPKFGIAPARDIWFSFSSQLGPLGISGLDEFNDTLSNLGKAVVNENPPEDSYNNLKKFFGRVESDGKGEVFNDIITTSEMTYGQNIYHVPDLAMFLKRYSDQQRGLFEYIEYLLDPDENAFEVKDYKSPFYPDKDVEVWTSGSALLIRKDKWDEFFQEIIGMDTPFKK